MQNIRDNPGSVKKVDYAGMVIAFTCNIQLQLYPVHYRRCEMGQDVQT